MKTQGEGMPPHVFTFCPPLPKLGEDVVAEQSKGAARPMWDKAARFTLLNLNDTSAQPRPVWGGSGREGFGGPVLARGGSSFTRQCHGQVHCHCTVHSSQEEEEEEDCASNGGAAGEGAWVESPSAGHEGSPADPRANHQGEAESDDASSPQSVCSAADFERCPFLYLSNWMHQSIVAIQSLATPPQGDCLIFSPHSD